jgi:flavodoxin
MKALVVYESYFGNTEQVAQAMGEALAEQGDVAVVKAAEVKPEQLAGLDVLVVGSPTRAFRAVMTVVDMLKSIPANSLSGVKVAAFDTRINVTAAQVPGILRVMAKWFGYAAEKIAKLLGKKGGELAMPPEGYYVLDSEGPLKEGELERAAEWVVQVLASS